ncbi:DUF177 domain-containing protein [Novosphingobium bradum]|uniref:DUF177 domain-containing protein n=1 Tax=Novosphingobium bradum TaxID=1737444 RepID=A0ABV7IM21_9SPHN
MSAASEFSRIVELRQITGAPLHLVANADERAALARRFALVRLDRLEATVSLVAEGLVVAVAGRMAADWVQPCAISGEDLPQGGEEAISLRFVPERQHKPDEEIELSASELDEIEYAGTAFDLGEAVAQSLALAIDPFAAGPEAEQARQAAGIVGEGEAGAFAALAGLKLPKG